MVLFINVLMCCNMELVLEMHKSEQNMQESALLPVSSAVVKSYAKQEVCK